MNAFAETLRRRGIVVLENFIDNDTCENIINDFNQFKINSGNSATLNHRLYNIHLQSENVRNILFSDKIASFDLNSATNCFKYIVNDFLGRKCQFRPIFQKNEWFHNHQC